MVAAAPFVQEITTVPVPSSGELAWVVTGSYEPNASAVVLIEQLLATVAVTLSDAVAVAANAVVLTHPTVRARAPARATERWNFMAVNPCRVTRCRLKRGDCTGTAN